LPAARARLLLAFVARLLVGISTVMAGVLLGAICAACGIPVLVVVAVALLLHGSTVTVARWKLRARRLRSHRTETSR
jgi:hypothetical protein